MSRRRFQQRQPQDAADSPSRDGRKRVTSRPILEMPRSYRVSGLGNQDTDVPERSKSAQPSSRAKPNITRRFITSSAAKKTSEPSSRRPRQAQRSCAEEENNIKEHGDGPDRHGQRPVAAVDWDRVCRRHAQSKAPFSAPTLQMMHTMPRLLRDLETMKVAADSVYGGSLSDAVHDAALDTLHVGELLCEHMQGQWTIG